MSLRRGLVLGAAFALVGCAETPAKTTTTTTTTTPAAGASAATSQTPHQKLMTPTADPLGITTE